MALLTGQKNDLSKEEGGWWAGGKKMESVFLSPSGSYFGIKNVMIIRQRKVVSPSSAHTAVPGFFATIASMF